jgi:class 3 adenylate cyclase
VGEEKRIEATAPVAATPAALWSFLADTDRLNRSVGLAPVVFVPVPDPARKGHYRAQTRVLGLTLNYDEYPFDFVAGRGYEVERRFHGGPLERGIFGIRIEPRGAGSTLTIFARVLPRGLLGTLAANLILEQKATKEILELVRAFEREQGVPAQAKPPAASVRLDVLDVRLSKLQSSGRVKERLRRRLMEGSDLEVIRMRPFEVADAWEEDRLGMLTTFLRAARGGVLDLVWCVVCPHCRVAAKEAAGLAELRAKARCETCEAEFGADFVSTLEARFSVNPAVRAAKKGAYCIGGPANMPGTLAQLRVPPGERTERLDLPPGPLRIRCYGAKGIATLPVAAEGARTIEAALDGGELRVKEAALAAGPVELRIRNGLSREALLVVEGESWSGKAATAAFVTSLQEFRDLFPGDAVAAGEELSIGSLALLFTDLKGSTELYERLGDGRAFEFVQGHFRFLVEATARNRGGVVKTMGDAIMAAFSSAEDAVKGALEMQAGWDAFRKGKEGVEDVLLKVGVHEGPAIAIRNADRLDYFGTTVNTAARVQAAASGGEVALTRSTAEHPGVAALLASPGLRTEPFRIPLKGLAGEQDLVRVRRNE